MDQLGNDVFARPAFAVNQDGNIGGGDLIQAAAESLHGLGLPENDCLGWNIAQRLHEGTDRICHCGGHVGLRLLERINNCAHQEPNRGEALTRSGNLV